MDTVIAFYRDQNQSPVGSEFRITACKAIAGEAFHHALIR